MKRFPVSVSQMRLAGFFYLVIILCGVSSEAVLRAPLIDTSSARDTAQAILSGITTYRMSIAADVVMALADVALAVLLFLVFRHVAPGMALAAMVFRMLQASVIVASLSSLHMVTVLLGTGVPEAPMLALSFAQLQAFGYDLGLVFFGVNCLLTGYLIHHSGFMPRVLGYGIAVSGLVYLTGSALRLLVPDLVDVFAIAYVVPLVAETALCFWLLVLPGSRQPDQGVAM